jgi:hypothetical protein
MIKLKESMRVFFVYNFVYIIMRNAILSAEAEGAGS